MRPTIYSRPPKRPAQTANNAGVLMGASNVTTLLEDVVSPELTILEGEGTSEGDTAAFPTNIGGPTARR